MRHSYIDLVGFKINILHKYDGMMRETLQTVSPTLDLRYIFTLISHFSVIIPYILHLRDTRCVEKPSAIKMVN